MKTIKTLLTTALTLVATAAPVLSCACGTVRMTNQYQVMERVNVNFPYGEVCHAETGRVYLRNSDLSYSANSTLSNGTRIEFIGATKGYARVFVPSTNQVGWITIRYTCAFQS